MNLPVLGSEDDKSRYGVQNEYRFISSDERVSGSGDIQSSGIQGSNSMRFYICYI